MLFQFPVRLYFCALRLLSYPFFFCLIARLKNDFNLGVGGNIIVSYSDCMFLEIQHILALGWEEP